MAVTFRVGEEKRTTVRELEIEVETKPLSLPEVPGITGAILTALLRPITLNPGLHHFRLVIEDQNGNLSQPATVEVTVLGKQ
jgi:hypothetical protein